MNDFIPDSFVTDDTPGICEESSTKPPAIQPLFTPKSLAQKVEQIVKDDHLTYIEAIIALCDQTGVDPEDMAKLVQGPLKDKVEAEARKSNILPRTNSLFDEEDED